MNTTDSKQPEPSNEAEGKAGFAGAHGSAVLCDMLGCREHATGEVQTGDEYIPLCELHRQSEMERLAPKWRPLPPHPPNDPSSATAKD